MKRILIISPMPPLIGGVSVSSKRLYDNLKNDGYDVDVYNVKFKNTIFNRPIFIFLKFLIIPIYIIAHKRYDIIHCHVAGDIRKFYIALFKPFFKKAKLFYTIHGDIKTLLNKTLFLLAMNKADRIICVQNGDSLKLPEKIRHNAVDIPAFIIPNNIKNISVPKYILTFLSEKNIPKIIMNGSIVTSENMYDLYGFEDTVSLFFRLKEMNINTRLVMIVNGLKRNIEQENLLKKISEQIVNENNILLVTDEIFELMPLFQYCDICLRPTKTDGDSLTIREALSMGCKVIASDVSARPEGTITYHFGDPDNLLEKVIEALDGLKDSNKNKISTDFYKLIKEQYENC